MWFVSGPAAAGPEIETIEFTAVDNTARVDLNRDWRYRCHEPLACCGDFRFEAD
jgi:hypothetical protein